MTQREILNNVNPGIYAMYPGMEDVIEETLLPSQAQKNKPVYKQVEEVTQNHQITHQVEQSNESDVTVKTVNLKINIELNIKTNVI